jgi:hypothetical protein
LEFEVFKMNISHLISKKMIKIGIDAEEKNEIIKELAYSLDLDPDEVINDPAAAEIYAKIIGLQNAQQQGQEQPTGPGVESAMGSAQGVPPEVAGTDSQGTGDGTIGTGVVPSAGEAGFTGNSPQVEE